MEQRYDTLVLSGGGTRAIPAEIGALRGMEAKNQRKGISTIIGASAGCLIGALAALHLTSYEIEELFQQQAAQEFFAPSVTSCLGGGGLSGPCAFRAKFSRWLERYIRMGDITLGEVRDHFGVDFQAVAFDNIMGQVHILRAAEDPDMLLVDAVYAAIALPFFFSPLPHKHYSLSDGGVVYNFPVAEAPGPATLGIYVPSRYMEVKSAMNVVELVFCNYQRISAVASCRILPDRLANRPLEATMVYADNDIATSLETDVPPALFRRAIARGCDSVCKAIDGECHMPPDAIPALRPVCYHHCPDVRPPPRNPPLPSNTHPSLSAFHPVIVTTKQQSSSSYNGIAPATTTATTTATAPNTCHHGAISAEEGGAGGGGSSSTK